MPMHFMDGCLQVHLEISVDFLWPIALSIAGVIVPYNWTGPLASSHKILVLLGNPKILPAIQQWGPSNPIIYSSSPSPQGTCLENDEQVEDGDGLSSLDL
ncbi:unnamed protein product [Citrullus colocynthis]|uniref:Uncharacterized protein n=1 Tax=Citrullus colocynthis TaxID=252529 RepID=A0ABP0YC21_9ROSI